MTNLIGSVLVLLAVETTNVVSEITKEVNTVVEGYPNMGIRTWVNVKQTNTYPVLVFGTVTTTYPPCWDHRFDGHIEPRKQTNRLFSVSDLGVKVEGKP